jgi:hypothetical protein
MANGLVEPGTYRFNEEGVMVNNPADDLKGEIVEVDGELWYYVKGEVRKNIGLVEVDGCWYYVQYSGKVKVSDSETKRVNQTVQEDKVNNYAGGAGTYSFFSDGVMYDPLATEDGEVVNVDGVLYYYVDGHVRKDAGLVKLANGDYIFVTYSGKLKVDAKQTVKESTCNGHTDLIGAHKFDANGVMVK